MVVSKTVTSIELGGKDLDHYLMRILAEGGYISLSNTDYQTFRDLKEKICYFSIDYDKQMLDMSSNANLEESYELPDGRIVVIKNERFRCPEVLFQTNFYGMDSPGIHQIIVNAVKKCNSETQDSFYSNIVLSGCTSNLPGFAERMQKEILILVQPKMKIIVNIPMARLFLTIYPNFIMSQITSAKKNPKKKWSISRCQSVMCVLTSWGRVLKKL